MRNPLDDGRFRRAPPSAVERLEHKAQRDANEEPERRLRRTQAKQTDESTADDSREQRFVGAVDEPQQPPEQRHQEGAAEHAEPEWLDLARAPPDAADRFGRRQQNGTDHGAAADPDPIDRVADHGAGRGAEHRPPDQRVENAAGAAPFASVRIPHASGVSRRRERLPRE